MIFLGMKIVFLCTVQITLGNVTVTLHNTKNSTTGTFLQKDQNQGMILAFLDE